MLGTVRRACLTGITLSAIGSIVIAATYTAGALFVDWLWWLVGGILVAVLLTTVFTAVVDDRLQIGGWRAGASPKADLIRWSCALYAGIGVIALLATSNSWLDEVFWPASILAIGHALLFSHWYFEVKAVMMAAQPALEDRPDGSQGLDDGQP